MQNVAEKHAESTRPSSPPPAEPRRRSILASELAEIAERQRGEPRSRTCLTHAARTARSR